MSGALGGFPKVVLEQFHRGAAVLLHPLSVVGDLKFRLLVPAPGPMSVLR